MRLLDTPAEPFFDSITRFATRLFNVPSALVTFVDDDRQWFKSRVAFGCEQTPRSVSFCAHSILDSRPTVVLDARADRRFGNNPLVTGAPAIRFYAGAPLVLGNDIVVGTLCLIDYEPRFSFSVDDEATLMALAELVTERLSMLGSMAYMDEITGLPNLARFNVDVPVFTEDSDALHERFSGSFENSVGNAAQRACELNAAKLSFPAMRNKTVRMVSKRAYPRALRFAA